MRYIIATRRLRTDSIEELRQTTTTRGFVVTPTGQRRLNRPEVQIPWNQPEDAGGGRQDVKAVSRDSLSPVGRAEAVLQPSQH